MVIVSVISPGYKTVEKSYVGGGEQLIKLYGTRFLTQFLWYSEQIVQRKILRRNPVVCYGIPGDCRAYTSGSFSAVF